LLTGFCFWRDGLRWLTWFTETSSVLGFNTELVFFALLQSTCCTSQQTNKQIKRRSFFVAVNIIGYLEEKKIPHSV